MLIGGRLFLGRFFCRDHFQDLAGCELPLNDPGMGEPVFNLNNLNPAHVLAGQPAKFITGLGIDQYFAGLVGRPDAADLDRPVNSTGKDQGIAHNLDHAWIPFFINDRLTDALDTFLGESREL